MSRFRYLPDRDVLGPLLEAAGVEMEPESPAATAEPIRDHGFLAKTANQEPASKPQPKQPAAADKKISVRPQPASGETEEGLPREQPAKPLPSSLDSERSAKPKPISFRFNPKLPLEENLKKFLVWLVRENPAEGGFLADSQGLSLAEENVSMDVIESTGALSQGLSQMAAFGPNTEVGFCTFQLDQMRYLQLTWADTSAGRIFLGLVTSKLMKTERVRFIRLALKKIVG